MCLSVSLWINHVSLSVCVCINHELVHVITHHPFKLGSSHFDQRCKTPRLRSLLFWGWLILTFTVKFNLNVQISWMSVFYTRVKYNHQSKYKGHQRRVCLVLQSLIRFLGGGGTYLLGGEDTRSLPWLILFGAIYWSWLPRVFWHSMSLFNCIISILPPDCLLSQGVASSWGMISTYLYVGQVMKVCLSCYLDLLSNDSKTRHKTSPPSWPDPLINRLISCLMMMQPLGWFRRTFIHNSFDLREIPSAGHCMVSGDRQVTWHSRHTQTFMYRQVSDIRRTKSQHLKDSRTVLRLSLPNPLNPDVKSRMKM